MFHKYNYAKFYYNDGFAAILLDRKATMSDHLLMAVLSLLHKEVSEHGRHLPHYFSLFHTYACLGNNERTQLLKVIFHLQHTIIKPLKSSDLPTFYYLCIVVIVLSESSQMFQP